MPVPVARFLDEGIAHIQKDLRLKWNPVRIKANVQANPEPASIQEPVQIINDTMSGMITQKQSLPDPGASESQ
jgi:hypothetical protein